jgi:hypothetical protein
MTWPFHDSYKEELGWLPQGQINEVVKRLTLRKRSPIPTEEIGNENPAIESVIRQVAVAYGRKRERARLATAKKRAARLVNPMSEKPLEPEPEFEAAPAPVELEPEPEPAPEAPKPEDTLYEFSESDFEEPPEEPEPVLEPVFEPAFEPALPEDKPEDKPPASGLVALFAGLNRK